MKKGRSRAGRSEKGERASPREDGSREGAAGARRRKEGAADYEATASETKAALNHEFWKPLHFHASMGHLECIKEIISEGEDANVTPSNKAVPEVTPLHIAAATGNVDVIKLLLPLCDVNRQDQWGFSALHYATVARKTEAVHLLLSNGASASLASKSGCTAKDLAQELKYEDIVAALVSRQNLEKDPTIPVLKRWLNSVGAGQYVQRFLDAGYSLPFIAKHGLSKKDLDCVGVPASKMGVRQQLIALFKIDEFYSVEKESGSEGEGEKDSESENENSESEEESDS